MDHHVSPHTLDRFYAAAMIGQTVLGVTALGLWTGDHGPAGSVVIILSTIAVVVVLFTLIELVVATVRAKTWTLEEIIRSASNNVLVGAAAVVVYSTLDAPAIPWADLAALTVVGVLLAFGHSVTTAFYRVLKDSVPPARRPYLT